MINTVHDRGCMCYSCITIDTVASLGIVCLVGDDDQVAITDSFKGLLVKRSIEVLGGLVYSTESLSKPEKDDAL